MAAGKAKGIVLPLQTAHHQTSFERRNNQMASSAARTAERISAIGHPRRSISNDLTTNEELAELCGGAEGLRHRIRWQCSKADILRAPGPFRVCSPLRAVVFLFSCALMRPGGLRSLFKCFSEMSKTLAPPARNADDRATLFDKGIGCGAADPLRCSSNHDGPAHREHHKCFWTGPEGDKWPPLINPTNCFGCIFIVTACDR